mgnify:FL=1
MFTAVVVVSVIEVLLYLLVAASSNALLFDRGLRVGQGWARITTRDRRWALARQSQVRFLLRHFYTLVWLDSGCRFLIVVQLSCLCRAGYVLLVGVLSIKGGLGMDDNFGSGRIADAAAVPSVAFMYYCGFLFAAFVTNAAHASQKDLTREKSLLFIATAAAASALIMFIVAAVVDSHADSEPGRQVESHVLDWCSCACSFLAAGTYLMIWWRYRNIFPAASGMSKVVISWSLLLLLRALIVFPPLQYGPLVVLGSLRDPLLAGTDLGCNLIAFWRLWH